MRNSWKKYEFQEIIKSTQLGTDLIGNEQNSGIPLLKMGNLTIGGFDFGKLEKLTATNPDQVGKFVLNRGDFLFNTRNTLELVGKSAVWKNSLSIATFNSNIMRIKFHGNLADDFYLGFYFSQGEGWTQFKRITTGTTSVAAIYSRDLFKCKITLPPLTQQITIAKILSTCDEVIEKTEAAIAKYQALKQGMMHDLFTRGIDVKTGKLRPSYQDAPELYEESKLGMIPKEWVVEPLGGENQSYAGGTPNRSIEHYYKGQIPWVSSGEVNKPFIYSTKETITEEALRFSSAKMAPKESVLIAMYGATAAQISMLKIEASTNQAVLAIIAGSSWDNYFIYYGLNFSKERILFLAQGSGQPNLNKGMIDSTLFWKPNIKEQHLIVERLSSLEKKSQFEESALAKYQQLKAGLMQDLLTGKVEVRFAEEIVKN